MFCEGFVEAFMDWMGDVFHFRGGRGGLVMVCVSLTIYI